MERNLGDEGSATDKDQIEKMKLKRRIESQLEIQKYRDVEPRYMRAQDRQNNTSSEHITSLQRLMASKPN